MEDGAEFMRSWPDEDEAARRWVAPAFKAIAPTFLHRMDHFCRRSSLSKAPACSSSPETKGPFYESPRISQKHRGEIT